jgi:hypothetical protein
MRPASYGDVAIGSGPLRKQFRARHATLLAVDARRLHEGRYDGKTFLRIAEFVVLF